MSKWMDNWLYERDKKNKERELDHCFRELMEMSGGLRKKYKDIPDSVFQEYLNCECSEKEQEELERISGEFFCRYAKKKVLKIDGERKRKYPNLENDIVVYLEKKAEFFSLCMDLDMMDEWKDDDLFDDYAGHHFGWYL